MTNRLKRALAAVALAGGAASAANGATIANWGFEAPVTPPDTSNVVAVGPYSPNEGTGSARGVHASAATDYSTPSGNGSAESLSSNTWAIGDYYEFEVSTVGFTDVMVSFDQTRSGTGPATFDFAYSTDGTTFTTILDNYTVLENATVAGPDPLARTSFTATGSRQSIYTISVDLSAIDALEGDPSVFFRLISQVTPAAGGTNRVDNFNVVAVPEPAALSLIGLGMLALSGRPRNR